MPLGSVIQTQPQSVNHHRSGHNSSSCSVLCGCSGLIGRVVSVIENTAASGATNILNCCYQNCWPIIGGAFLSLAGRYVIPIAEGAPASVSRAKKVGVEFECVSFGGKEEVPIVKNPTCRMDYQLPDYPKMPNGSSWRYIHQACVQQPGKENSNAYQQMLTECGEGGKFNSDCPHTVELKASILEKYGSWDNSLRASQLSKGIELNKVHFENEVKVPLLVHSFKSQTNTAPTSEGPFHDATNCRVWWEKSPNNSECIRPKWGWPGWPGAYSSEDNNSGGKVHDCRELCFDKPNSVSKWHKNCWITRYAHGAYAQIDAERNGLRQPIKKVPFTSWNGNEGGDDWEFCENACNRLKPDCNKND